MTSNLRNEIICRLRDSRTNLKVFCTTLLFLVAQNHLIYLTVVTLWSFIWRFAPTGTVHVTFFACTTLAAFGTTIHSIVIRRTAYQIIVFLPEIFFMKTWQTLCLLNPFVLKHKLYDNSLCSCINVFRK